MLFQSIETLKESISNANGRIDFLTDDVKETKRTSIETRDVVKELVVAVEKLGGKIDYQNVILKRENGEAGNLQQGEH